MATTTHVSGDMLVPVSEQAEPQGELVHGQPGMCRVRADPVYTVKAQLFRILGHPVRIRIIELLNDGEKTVGELQSALDLDPSGTSQHLAALRQLTILENRRVGTSVYYRLRDARVSDLLTLGAAILTSSLNDSRSVLQDLADHSLVGDGASTPSSSLPGDGGAPSARHGSG
jgi:DNA-binding transcriptional ArsR family regulator